MLTQEEFERIVWENGLKPIELLPSEVDLLRENNAALNAEIQTERAARQKAEAELAGIKAGKGWYEDTPAGIRKHCWVSGDEELKSAQAELAECGRILGQICCVATLSPGETLKESISHAAIDAILSVVKRWHDCEAERDRLKAELADLRQQRDFEWKSRKEQRERAIKAEAQLAEAVEKLVKAEPLVAELAKRTEGETRAYVEALSFRLGFGHAIDVQTKLEAELAKAKGELAKLDSELAEAQAENDTLTKVVEGLTIHLAEARKDSERRQSAAIQWALAEIRNELRTKQELAEARKALNTIANAPTDGYVDAGQDCGNSSDVYRDGQEAGYRYCAGIARAALGAAMKEKKP